MGKKQTWKMLAMNKRIDNCREAVCNSLLVEGLMAWIRERMVSSLDLATPCSSRVILILVGNSKMSVASGIDPMRIRSITKSV